MPPPPQGAGGHRSRRSLESQGAVPDCRRTPPPPQLSLASWGDSATPRVRGKRSPFQAPSVHYEQIGFAWAEKHLKQQLRWASRGG